MARHLQAESPDFERTAELPVLRFGAAGQLPPDMQPTRAPTADPIAETATWIASTPLAQIHTARIAQLERELTELRTALSERDILIDRLRAQIAGYGAAPEQGAEAQAATMRLLVRTAGDSGIVHVLGRRSTIGRTPDNDIHVDAASVSRHHAVVLSVGAETFVEDLHSANGVCVNGTRVTRQALSEGDIVDIGETRFRFLLKRA